MRAMHAVEAPTGGRAVGYSPALTPREMLRRQLLADWTEAILEDVKRELDADPRYRKHAGTDVQWARAFREYF